MTEDVCYTTEECAERLNRAYGWKAITRQTILYEIRCGRLPSREVPAAGSRERALVRVTRQDFLDYCFVYHPDVRTAIKSVCNN